jgi:hypothetical protein
MPPQDLSPTGFKDPYSLFNYLVATGGKVLLSGAYASEESRGILIRLGYVVEETKKDLRLLGLEAETLDAIWWTDANATYSIEDAFRILQSLFRALHPKTGILVFTFSKEDTAKEKQLSVWNLRTVMTLLRQTGLQLFHTFENPTDRLLFCQRL